MHHCLKPTNTIDLYILAGIAHPDIRRAVASRAMYLPSVDKNHREVS